MNNISDLSATIVPKSDQLNADQLLGGSITVKVTSVRLTDGDQPIVIGFEGDDGRPYKPCKSMRKIILFAWGVDGNKWIGRWMTLYNDPEVSFGGKKVGGVRISHMSHIERDIKASITVTRGKKSDYSVKRLDVAEQPTITPEQSAKALEQAAQFGMEKLVEAWKITPADIRSSLYQGKCPQRLKDIAASIDASAEVQQ